MTRSEEVDVDLIGYIDNPNKYYSPARTLRCTT